MGQFVVAGGRRLAGTFVVSGSKNAALPILAATTLVAAPVTVRGVPLGLSDVQHMLAMLRDLGVRVASAGPSAVAIDASGPLSSVLPEQYTRAMRASVFLMGPLLGRLGRVTVSRPGGCNIGPRPIDLHLKGLAALSVRFEDRPGGHIEGQAHSALSGAVIYLDFPSVGATENVMMAAVMASGDTFIENAAREPEVVDLAQFLNAMGAEVHGAGTDRVWVRGQRPLHGGAYELIPDRIEAGTVAVAAAMTGGDVTLAHVIPEHLTPLWRKLGDMGVDVQPSAEGMRVAASGPLTAASLRTGPHPGFPTDLQPLMLALMTQASGCSTLVETVFENRLRHALEMRRMGANVLTDGRMAVIYGPSPLDGAVVEATDLRAGAALIVAGLAARGTTTVLGADMVARGYENWAERLSALGAAVVLEP